MRHFIVAATLVCCFAASALAQESPTPTLEQRQTQAEQLLVTAGAGDVFAIEDHAPAVAVRHTRSGMLCRFGYDRPNQSVSIVPSTSLGVARGDDVACGNTSELGALTLYATRYPEPYTLDQALTNAVAAVQAMHPGARPVDPSSLERVTIGDRAPPESRTAAFIVTHQGQQLFTRVSVYVRDGWTYKMRFTAPNPRMNFIAEMMWTTMLLDLPPSAAP
jgi:hypothetical protein